MPEGLRVEAVSLAEKLKPHGKTLTDAVQHYLAYLAAVERTCLVSELTKEFLSAKRKDGARAEYVRDLEARLARFEQDFGPRKVAEVTPQEIDDWLRGLPVGPQTRNNFRTVLGTAFAFAVARNYSPANPIERTAKAKVTRGAPGIFTPAEIRALLTNASAAYLPALAIGAFAGIRPAEIERLDWADIDFARSLIHLTGAQTKTSARRLVTIHPTLAAWLAPLAKTKGAVLIGDERKLRIATMKAAKLTKWPADGLRHSFASYHLAQFRNVAETATQLGHQNAKMIFAHYRELVLPEHAAEWWQITPPADHGNVVAFSAGVAHG